MNTRFVQQGDSVTFVIDQFDEKYSDVLKGLYYQRDGASYVKSFPATLATEQVQANFARYARSMFDQIGGFAPVRWERSIEEFARRAQAADIDWWLTGSGALAVRGIPVSPHDIDIMLCSENLPRVQAAFAEHIIEPIVPTDGWIMKHFGVAFLEARIDLAFDPMAAVDQPDPADFGPYAREHLETVSWHGLDVRVPPVNLHLASNLQRSRLDRVELIREYLARQRR